jgi:signal transduction histidine kinase
MFSALKRISRSFSFRLTAWHSALLLIAAVASLGTAYVRLQHMTITRERDTIEQRLSFLEAAYSRGGADMVAEVASLSDRSGRGVFFMQVADEQNRSIAMSRNDIWKTYTAGALDFVPIPDPGTTSWISLPGADGSLVLVGRRLGDGRILRVGRATSESRRVLHGFGELALVSLATLIPLVFVSGWILARRALRPVRSLTTTVRDIVTTGRFSSRVPSTGTGDDIDELVVCFNLMLGKIEKLMTGLSESLDFAAHDLRTPLTRLRNSAQSALQKPLDSAAQSNALADCIEESDRVLATVRRLIELAATEGGVATFERVPIDFESLAQETMELFREVAEARDVRVSIEAESGSVALADREAMRRVVSNLLDNAIKYTKAGSDIEILIRRAAQGIELRVSDCGEGISGEDLPHIWSKLFRARRSASPPGAGLGLSIVKAIVEAHGGLVRAESTLGQGSVFTICLPAA